MKRRRYSWQHHNSLSSPVKRTLLMAKRLSRTGTSKGCFSAPVSTATVQKVRKLGVSKKAATQTGWAGNALAE